MIRKRKIHCENEKVRDENIEREKEQDNNCQIMLSLTGRKIASQDD